MPRPRQVRRTAVSAFSARSGRSVSRLRPAQPITSSLVQGQEHRVAVPRRVPLLGTDLQRRVQGEVGEHLLAERLEAGGPQVGASARVDHLDAGRRGGRGRFVAHRAYLFDLAVDLDEPEAVGERQGLLIVDTGPDDRGQAQAAAVLGQGSQERRPHAQATMPGQDARGDESRPGGIGPIGDAGAHHVAVLDGEQQQSVRRVLRTKLLDAVQRTRSTASRTARHASYSSSVTQTDSSINQTIDVLVRTGAIRAVMTQGQAIRSRGC